MSQLCHGYAYEFRVIAANDAGRSVPSLPSNVTVARQPMTSPGEPRDPRVINTTEYDN